MQKSPSESYLEIAILIWRSVSKVFEIHAGTSLQKDQLRVSDQLETDLGDISGSIVLQSTAVSILIRVTFPATTFLQMMSNILGENVTKIDETCANGAGEIANMIYGDAKAKLNDLGNNFQMSLPKTHFGQSSSHDLIKGATLISSYQSKYGQLSVEICFLADAGAA